MEIKLTLGRKTVMAFFDELGAKLTKTGQMTVQKANDLAEVTRLNMRTGELNKAIQEHYAKLGERYYALHAAGPEEDLAAICGLIDKANEELESIRLELQRIRQLKVCPACGAENPSDASFCSKCSAALPELPPRPVEPGTRFCASCGAKIAETAQFCTKCGAKQPPLEAPEENG